MELKEFIESFVCPNTLIRLWYPIKGGNEQVVDGDNPQMEWSMKDGKYKHHKVIGVTDILMLGSHYSEAVNIVIEKH